MTAPRDRTDGKCREATRRRAAPGVSGPRGCAYWRPRLLLALLSVLAGAVVRPVPAISQEAGDDGGAREAAGPGSTATATADGRFVYVIPIEDAIGPVIARFAVQGIERAGRDGAAAAVIQMDTPGGLDTSMRQMIKAILGSEVPVVVYVAPSGARAASAGMYITLAAHVAAMAPGTNIGAATPVTIGGGPGGADSSAAMRAKMTNDAAAYARSLAERHGRNAAWAERAVREAASLPAEEALRDTVIDVIASSLPELLAAIDGRAVRLGSGEIRLETRAAEPRHLEMSRRERLLALLSNPSIAYLLFLAGILGIALELYNPGAVLPGVVGGISLILAFFAFQSLPVSAAGILLILLGIVLFILEVKVPSYGVLSIGGVTSLILGSLFLFDRGSAFRVSLSFVLPTALTFAAVFVVVIWLAARAQRRPKQGGVDGMVGEIGSAVTALALEGKVFVHGEYWNARATSPVPAGAQVRVRRVRGLLVEVEPAGPADEAG